MKKTTLAVACALGALSASSIAASHVADARSNAMGNTGVVSADYLLAPFHNPALGALYRDNDDFGILIPAIGVNVHDKDETIKTVDDAQDLYDEIKDGSSTDVAKLDKLLADLNGNAPIAATAGLNFAVAIPTQVVSVNLFAGGFTEVIAAVDIANDVNPETRFDNSKFAMTAFGVSEFGLSLSKSFDLAGQEVAFGISPKYQKLLTYSQVDKIENFDLDDYDQSETSDSAVNVDMGVAWRADVWRAGLSMKNLIAQEIDTQAGNYTYELNPQAMVGLGYVGDYLVASVDLDLTKQKRFKQLKDDTRFLRFGIELNAWGWAQLRAGYEMDMEDTLDNSVTAGVGVSPFDAVSVDVAGSYAGENQFGASANLALTF